MQPARHLHFRKKPSLTGLFFTALRNSRPLKRNPGGALALRARWHNIPIDQRHLQAFHSACGLPAHAGISLLYPMTWAYPLILRLLSDRAAPMPLFHALNTRMVIQQYLEISHQDRPVLELAVAAVRRTDKGLEMDICIDMQVHGLQVWNSMMTFFYRGRFDGEVDRTPTDPAFRVDKISSRHAWRISTKGAFRFGQLCGDTNPIHYGKAYAKAFGFDRDFAQPLLVLGRALSHLPLIQPAGGMRLEARLKGPVYYEREVSMLAENKPDGHCFDIYCAPNPKASIRAQITPLR